MAREARKVTADWRHPVDIDGKLIPMLEPQMADLMKCVRNHLQMYETTSEGTPMSPVFARAEELAQWLADHEIPLFGDLLATREQWLKIIEDSAESIPVLEKPTKMSNLIQYAVARGRGGFCHGGSCEVVRAKALHCHFQQMVHVISVSALQRFLAT